MQAVQKVKDYIIAGDVFQVVLSQKFTAKGHVDGFELYRNLRKENPSPYLSYIRLADVEILCSSPEMLVRLDEESVETKSLLHIRISCHFKHTQYFVFPLLFLLVQLV